MGQKRSVLVTFALPILNLIECDAERPAERRNTPVVLIIIGDNPLLLAACGDQISGGRVSLVEIHEVDCVPGEDRMPAGLKGV